MSKYKAILYDLDGTLIPMDMKEFTNGYFYYLAKKLKPFGIEKDELVPAIWTGTKAMVENDGSDTNDRVFWKKFEEVTGKPEATFGPQCLDYYTNEFKNAKQFTKDNPLAKEAIRISHEKAPIVALSTNPLFPMAGQITRMGWVDLKPSDFDLVTSYETDCYCKPNPKYFLSVAARLNVKPSECLVIGNDEYEDMWSATQAGMDGYLITDTMIKSEKHPWNGPKGSFKDMIEMLKAL